MRLGLTVLTARQALYFLGYVFVPLFLLQQGLQVHALLLLYACVACVGMLTIPFVRSFHIRVSLAMGFLFFMLIPIGMLLSPIMAFLSYAVLEGLSLGIFWIPLNYVFFQESRRHATDSSWYILTDIVPGIILPPLGALMIAAFGFGQAFIITGMLAAVPLFWILFRVKRTRIDAPFLESVARYKGLKTITALNGALNFFRSMFIPVYGLLYFHTEMELGGFISFLNIAAILAMFYLSQRSDKGRYRMRYLIPLCGGMSLVTFVMSQTSTAVAWLLLGGSYVALDYISSPVRLAIAMDVKEKDMGFWKAMEFFTNMGRVIFLGMASLFLFLNLHLGAFALFGVTLLVYPVLVRKKLKQIR